MKAVCLLQEAAPPDLALACTEERLIREAHKARGVERLCLQQQVCLQSGKSPGWADE